MHDIISSTIASAKSNIATTAKKSSEADFWRYSYGIVGQQQRRSFCIESQKYFPLSVPATTHYQSAKVIPSTFIPSTAGISQSSTEAAATCFALQDFDSTGRTTTTSISRILTATDDCSARQQSHGTTPAAIAAKETYPNFSRWNALLQLQVVNQPELLAGLVLFSSRRLVSLICITL